MFDSFDASKKNQLILRHDIDFDIKAAYEIALIEHEINVKSTFFFLLRGDFYNLINSENYDLVKKIESLGHKISLHYDIEIYTDPKKELIAEIKIFEDFLIQKLILSVFTDLAKIFLKIQIIILMFQIHTRINILNKYHTLQTQEDDLDLGTL